MLGSVRAEHLDATRRQERDVPGQLRRTLHRLEQLHHQQARSRRRQCKYTNERERIQLVDGLLAGLTGHGPAHAGVRQRLQFAIVESTGQEEQLEILVDVSSCLLRARAPSIASSGPPPVRLSLAL